MTLSRKIADALEARPDILPVPDAEPVVIEVSEGDRRLSLALTASSSIGASLRSVGFARVEPREASIEELQDRGERLARRITYLLEPLIVLEVDREAGELQLRSKSPSTRGESRSYYEALLRRDGSCELRRYAHGDPSEGRRAVPFQLTREIIERLSDDLEGILG